MKSVKLAEVGKGVIGFDRARIILTDRVVNRGWLTVARGKIIDFGEGRLPKSNYDKRFDLAGEYLSPGFVDIHVHGGGGADFMDGTIEAVQQACQTHVRHGTTTIFPTTTTGSRAEIMAMIEACRAAQQQNETPENAVNGPRIGGVHLYGPYFAPDKTGCHRIEGCRAPTRREFQAYFETDMIRIATCAAELSHAAEFYREAVKHDCLVTCGHSNASWSEMQSAFDLGMRHVDHFWCAMSNVSSVRARLGVPMQGSMLEFVLANSEMSTEVIADGWHLAPELLSFAYRMKSANKLCLVTDANRAVDMPPGTYMFGHGETGTSIESDGEVGWASKTSLASSVRGMDHMVRIMLRDSGAPLWDVIRMASLTPAELTGIHRSTGSIAKRKKADLVVLDQELQVKHTFVEGKLAFSS